MHGTGVGGAHVGGADAELVDVVVVGGGVAGLAAARAVLRARPGARVRVLESSSVLGGKLRSGPLADVAAVEEGVDALLARDPAAVDLVRDLGLGDRLEAPVTTAARVWRDGAARPLPGGTVLGLPTDLAALARSGVLSRAGVARAGLDLVLPGTPPQGDVAVGALVARRLGREVVDRLVDPLLGGVYAGRAEHLSLRATLPRLAPVVARQRSLLQAAASVRPAPSDAPVFLGLRGGFSTLVESLVADVRARGGQVRTRATVTRLEHSAAGRLRLVLGPAARQTALVARAVVVATPGPAAARLLRTVAPVAAVELGVVEMASVALVSLALPRGSLHPPPGSGLLVPAVEGRTVKAVTFATRKWEHLRAAAPGLELVRASLGRAGEEGVLARDDDALVAAVRADLTALAGYDGTAPVAARVSRWGGALPQYAVGHVERVSRARTALPAAVALAGASLDGVGVPACVRSGQRAAAHALAVLDAPTPAAAATLGA